MKKIIIGVLMIFVLIGAGFWYMNYQEEEELNQFAAEPNTANEATSTTETKTYTLADVSMHNKKSDCWLAIHGTVLDVTSFISKHPGGDRILEGCGKDASSLFDSVPGHNSSIAKMLVKKLTIGKLAN